MMRVRSRRDGSPRRRVVAVALLAAALSLLLVAPSSSAPGDPVPGEEDLPPAFSISPVSNGVVTMSQTNAVRGSKMFINIGGKDNPMFGVFYTAVFNTPAANPTAYLALCTRGRPCVPDAFFQPACATNDPTTQERGPLFESRLYPVTRLKTGGVEVGLLARVPVKMIAFGSIPAVATLTLRAPRIDGKVEPFRVKVLLVNTRGCDSNVPAREQRLHTLVQGRVEVSLSGLRVDGVPVDLGATCRTVRPADLQLWGDPGYTPGSGGSLRAHDGIHEGSRGPLTSPYWGVDNGSVIPKSTGLTIPPFTGCGVGGDDLSPLVSAMASGPNNPVVVNQGKLFPPDGGLDLNNLDEACLSTGECPLPGPDFPDNPPLPAGD